MYSLQRSLEKSARKVFRIFFGSRLYLKRDIPAGMDGDMIGVDMMMEFNGKKRISLFMERETVSSVRETLGAAAGEGNDADYDLIGEMANIITGNALGGGSGEVSISPPERSSGVNSGSVVAALNFSSKIGGFYITIEDMQIS